MHFDRHIVRIAAAAAAVAFTGCGGGASHTLPWHGTAANPGSSGGASSNRLPAAVSIRIPAGRSANVARGPKYVPATANGVAFTVWPVGQTMPATPTTVGDLSVGSSLCAGNADGSRTCTIQLQAPVGADNVVVTVYDQAPSGGVPAGNALSTQTLSYTIVAGANNTLPLVLGGIPAAVVLGPQPGYNLPPSPQTVTMTVNARDADGNTIVGPGLYTSPISLAVTNDPNGTTALSTATVTDPANNTVTINYNGGDLGSGVTITGSAAGARSGSLLFQRGTSGVVTVITVPGYSTGAFMLWNSATQRLDKFPAGAASGSSPVSFLQAPGYAMAVATDPSSGVVYAALSTGQLNVYSSTGTFQRSFGIVELGSCCGLASDGTNVYAGWFNNINVYPANATGSPAPIRSISGSATTLGTVWELSAATDGTLFVTDIGTNTVKIFAPGANGNVAPSATLAPSGQFLSGAVLASNGLLYVASNANGNSYVDVYSGSGTTYSRTAQIAGAATNANLACPRQIAADSSSIYVLAGCGYFATRVIKYAANANGDATPLGTITSSSFGAPFGIAANADGTLYVPNAATPDFDVVAPGSSGAVSPAVVWTGNGASGGPISPQQMATDAQGNVYVPSHSCSANIFDRVFVYAPGSTGNANPLRVIGGPNNAMSCIGGIAVDAQGITYVSNSYGGTNNGLGQINVYVPGASGDVAPFRTITSVTHPAGLAFDPAGNLWVADPGTNALRAYAPGASGNATPVATITSPQLNSPFGLAVDASGFVYANTGNTTLVFAPGSNGVSTPVRTLNSSSNSLAVDPSNDLFLGWGGIFAPNAAGSPPPLFTPAGAYPSTAYSAVLPLSGTNASAARRAAR